MCPHMPGTVQCPGKRDLFCTITPLPALSFSSFTGHQWDGGWRGAKTAKVQGGGEGEWGAWQTACEQRIEKDADVKAMNLLMLPFLVFPYFCTLHPHLALCCSCFFTDGPVLILPTQHLHLHQSVAPLVRSVVRKTWSDKASVCVC